MELIGTNQKNTNKNTKKIMIGITVVIIILLVISVILFAIIAYLKGQQFKFTIDGKNTTLSSEDLFDFEDDKVYVSLKDIAPLVGYTYNNGGYKQYSEDNTKCYMEGKDEIATLEMNSNIIYKTLVDELDYEYFTIDDLIVRKNNKLYITSEGLELACNLKFKYDSEKNQVDIYTLSYFVDYYEKNYKLSAITNNFKNQKALLYNLLVVSSEDTSTNTSTNASNIKYGVIDLNGQVIIGTKYTDIEFIESAQEFIVKTEENKVGIVTIDGRTRVTPQYDSLKQIDKNLNLYLATNNKKKGVIEKNGKILIYLEYDEIGIDAKEFQNNDIKNSNLYLLFDNAIPVKQNGKWGLFNKNGKLILPIEYDGFGCIPEDKIVDKLLLIPEIKCVVVSKDYETQRTENNKIVTDTVKYYGIVSYLGDEIVPASLQTIYSKTNNGRTEYKMVYNGEEYDPIEIYEQIIKARNSNMNNENTNQNEDNIQDLNTNQNEDNIQDLNTNQNDNTVTNQNNNEIITTNQNIDGVENTNI